MLKLKTCWLNLHPPAGEQRLMTGEKVPARGICFRSAVRLWPINRPPQPYRSSTLFWGQLTRTAVSCGWVEGLWLGGNYLEKPHFVYHRYMASLGMYRDLDGYRLLSVDFINVSDGKGIGRCSIPTPSPQSLIPT